VEELMALDVNARLEELAELGEVPRDVDETCVPLPAPAIVELVESVFDIAGVVAVDVVANKLEGIEDENMIVLEERGNEDENNTIVLEEEDTVPAGTDALELVAIGAPALVEDDKDGAVLDPPTTPPPLVLELVPAGAALELADFAAEDDDNAGEDEA
jgi:hypothetical protein